jgi:hypothetical protein
MNSLRNIAEIVAVLACVLVAVGCAGGYDGAAVDVTVDEPIEVEPTTQMITIRAGRPGTGTRTALDPLDNLKVNWLAADELGVYVDAVAKQSGNHAKTANSKFTIPAIGGLDTATDIARFTGNALPAPGTAECVDYYAYYPYFSSASSDYTALALTLPVTQKPTATSFDPAADILFGKARTLEVQVGLAQDGTEGILLDFVRPFAVGKLIFTDIPTEPTLGIANISNEIIRSVKLTFTTEYYAPVAGGFTVDLSASTPTPDFGSSELNTITLDYRGTNIQLKDLTTTPVYWVMNPVTVRQIELEIIAGDYIITRTIYPDNVNFEANHLNRATVSLDGADVIEINLLATGIDEWTGEEVGTYIPDANFLRALKGLFGGFSGTNPLTPSQAAGVSNLNIANEEITNLTGIEWFSGITSLQCHNNLLTSLDVSECTALQDLVCQGNRLASLDVSGCTALQSLSCNNNDLVSLDVSTNTALYHLRCDSNPTLETLTFGANTSLTYFDCTGDKLLGLDLSRIVTSKDYAFATFDCSGNPGNNLGEFFIVRGYDANSEGVPNLFPEIGATWSYNSSTVRVVYHYSNVQ